MLPEVQMAHAMLEGREHTLGQISLKTGIRQDAIGYYWRKLVRENPARWVIQGGAK